MLRRRRPRREKRLAARLTAEIQQRTNARRTFQREILLRPQCIGRADSGATASIDGAARRALPLVRAAQVSESGCRRARASCAREKALPLGNRSYLCAEDARESGNSGGGARACAALHPLSKKRVAFLGNGAQVPPRPVEKPTAARAPDTKAPSRTSLEERRRRTAPHERAEGRKRSFLTEAAEARCDARIRRRHASRSV